jgi:predicted transcriptional regulator
MVTEEKLVIKTVNKPNKEDLNELSEWFVRVFDLAGKNDRLESEMFKEIASRSIQGEGVTSKVLNEKLEVPRSTVIYHLNQFIYSGLIVRKGRRYYLRSDDMKSTMEEMQADMIREFGRLMAFAEKLDEILEEDAHGRKRDKKR